MLIVDTARIKLSKEVPEDILYASPFEVMVIDIFSKVSEEQEEKQPIPEWIQV